MRGDKREAADWMQILGKHFDEATILRIAGAFERVEYGHDKGATILMTRYFGALVTELTWLSMSF